MVSIHFTSLRFESFGLYIRLVWFGLVATDSERNWIGVRSVGRLMDWEENGEVSLRIRIDGCDELRTHVCDKARSTDAKMDRSELFRI